MRVLALCRCDVFRVRIRTRSGVGAVSHNVLWSRSRSYRYTVVSQPIFVHFNRRIVRAIRSGLSHDKSITDKQEHLLRTTSFFGGLTGSILFLQLYESIINYGPNSLHIRQKGTVRRDYHHLLRPPSRCTTGGRDCVVGRSKNPCGYVGM